MTDSETLRIELDGEASRLLAGLQGKYASELLSRAVDACGDGPLRISGADLRKLEATASKAETAAAGKLIKTGLDALTRPEHGGPRPGGSALRVPLIAGLSLLIGSGAALGAALIPSVVHDNTSRVLLAIAMVGTAAALIALTGLIVSRLTAGHAAARCAAPVRAAAAISAAPADAQDGHPVADLAAGAGPEDLADSARWSGRPDVHAALKFGWYVAEVRGWNRPAGRQPPGDSLPTRQEHALPLRIERTRTERRIESQAVLTALAAELDLDAPAPAAASGGGLMAVIQQQAKALAGAAPHTPAAHTGWDALAGSIYQLDAHAQDMLAARSDAQAAAYQLGRGLAESYWALSPAAPCEPLTADCWQFLLGQERCDELTRLAGRLSGYYSPYAPPAIAGTLKLWQSVAADAAWREHAEDDLYGQVRRWYGLLILGQDPATLIKPYALIRNWRTSMRAVRALWPQLVIAGLSLGLVIALTTLVAKGSGNVLLQAVFGVLSAVGLSAATIQARLKSTAQSLMTRFRQDAYTDLVAAAIAVAPKRPDGAPQDKVVLAEVRKRTLTTVADAAVP